MPALEGPGAVEQLLVRNTYRTLILGSHVLHYHGVVDAYGHLSARHPLKPDVFIMSRNMPPATVASDRDLVEYNVSDASPVDPSAPRGYLERCIHSEIYKKYPKINSVIHSHSHAVVPFTVSAVQLRPCFHMAGFLGHSTPIFDIAKHYQSDDLQDLLIRNTRLGEALASHFSSSDTTGNQEAQQAVVLMRGHGFTTVAASPEECVFRAIYTQDNAAIQTTSLALNAGLPESARAESGGIHFLSETEVAATTDMGQSAWTRAWSLWVREVQANSLYVIDA
ncbi:uncharacterized protein A1O9_11104 [Exophiala aquamarina CBS 119918]|uniref:Class II aldolase/adducin N-terminal domain-containing protein n=1 Tax=Exophiala aquamarina CBS 119918 TaxID=1182545 RepID=A0A072NZ41_9EURO|nr:uncharacterized protein A1O9_11104 [Exophiala aquamarina CBS 119918]KEF52687.1 hypothetical protein A1O9_11104 [Exophiala aquamarina CBS 119918]